MDNKKKIEILQTVFYCPRSYLEMDRDHIWNIFDKLRSNHNIDIFKNKNLAHICSTFGYFSVPDTSFKNSVKKFKNSQMELSSFNSEIMSLKGNFSDYTEYLFSAWYLTNEIFNSLASEYINSFNSPKNKSIPLKIQRKIFEIAYNILINPNIYVDMDNSFNKLTHIKSFSKVTELLSEVMKSYGWKKSSDDIRKVLENMRETLSKENNLFLLPNSNNKLKLDLNEIIEIILDPLIISINFMKKKNNSQITVMCRFKNEYGHVNIDAITSGVLVNYFNPNDSKDYSRDAHPVKSCVLNKKNKDEDFNFLDDLIEQIRQDSFGVLYKNQALMILNSGLDDKEARRYQHSIRKLLTSAISSEAKRAQELKKLTLGDLARLFVKL